MPAITDPDGPGGQPISIFESGAILQYLGRKTGQFYPAEERARVAVDEWVHWQMANLGPNAGQRNHFRNYAPTMVADSRQTAYGAIRYTNETHRLYGVLNGRLRGREFICDDYSIADMISWPWIAGFSSDALEMEDFPDLLAWKKRVAARDAVKRALAAAGQVRSAPLQAPGPEGANARNVLFGQRARP
jgi:glutathione S-transferase/GST-like protein